MGSQKVKKQKNKWRPNEEEERFVRENYGRMTKAAIIRKFNISLKEFERWCREKAVFANFDQKHFTKDHTGYTRVPVADPKYGCTTYLLVRPGKDPEEAKRKYYAKFEKKVDNETEN